MTRHPWRFIWAGDVCRGYSCDRCGAVIRARDERGQPVPGSLDCGDDGRPLLDRSSCGGGQ